jgi:translocation and assembly module TamA
VLRYYFPFFLSFLTFFTLPFHLAWGQTTAQAGERQRYQFELQAPADAGILLYRHLEVVRRQYDDDIDDEQLLVLADRAERQARNLLQTEGYFQPAIDVQLDKESELARITMVIDPGVPVRVTQLQLNLTGSGRQKAENFYEAYRLDEKWKISVGDIFRQEAWDASKNALLREYRLDIFPAARISYSEATINIEDQSAQLRVDIDPGEPMWFGELRIQGLSRYPASIIRNQKILMPGLPYSQNRVAEFQTSLLELPYFNNLTVLPLLDYAQDNYVPVLVEVEEVERRKLLLGVGYSSNTGVRGQIGFNDLNLRHRGWRLESLAKLETRQQSLEARLSLPPLIGGWKDSLESAWTRTNIEGLQTRTVEMELRRAKEEQRIVRAFILQAVYSVEQPQGRVRRGSRALVPGYDWTYRRLDSLIYPRQGYWLNLKAGIAAKGFISDQNFITSYGKYLHYWPLGAERDSLQWRLEGGVVWASSRVGIPQKFLFRAGGDQSLRGYDYQSVGVREGAAVVGGRYLALAGVEYTRWFSSQWGMGLFAEAGDAFDQGQQFKAALGLGLGPRWRSPIGPINVDVAYGERDRKWRLHFSLGVVF